MDALFSQCPTRRFAPLEGSGNRLSMNLTWFILAFLPGLCLCVIELTTLNDYEYARCLGSSYSHTHFIHYLLIDNFKMEQNLDIIMNNQRNSLIGRNGYFIFMAEASAIVNRLVLGH